MDANKISGEPSRYDRLRRLVPVENPPVNHKPSFCFKSYVENRRELAEFEAFRDALMDIIEDFGLREGRRFVADMVKDGYIMAIDGVRLMAEVRVAPVVAGEQIGSGLAVFGFTAHGVGIADATQETPTSSQP